MNYKDKQEWIEAVMASDLTPATKVYAFGIYKHMYGLKDDSFPGAKRIHEATGLNDGHFWKYNQALKDAGFLEVTSRRGTSNEYRLTEVTSTGGRYLPPEAVGVPPQEVGVTSTGGTNTTKNTTSKTSKEDQEAAVPADAVPTTSLNYEVPEAIEWEIEPLLNSQTTKPAADSNLKTAKGLPPQEVTQDATTQEDNMSELMTLEEWEREALIRKGSIYGATKEQIREAAAVLNATSVQGGTWGDKCEAALIKVGVGIDEWF